MRRIALTAATTLVLATPTPAQDVSFPTLTFPQPGTFCGPLQLCPPVTTRDVQE